MEHLVEKCQPPQYLALTLKNIIGKLAALLIESEEGWSVLMVTEEFHEFMVNRAVFH